MHKKKYQMPSTKVLLIAMESQVLTESPIATAPAHIVNAQRNGYGEAEIQIW